MEFPLSGLQKYGSFCLSNTLDFISWILKVGAAIFLWKVGVNVGYMTTWRQNSEYSMLQSPYLVELYSLST
jgi:hypothetical protein